METARLASRADVDAVVALWERSLSELAGQRGGALLAGSLERPDLAAHLTGALGCPDSAVVLGLIDEVPVGIASAVTDRRGRDPLGRIELIYVEPSARQVGVAEAMVDVVVSWCAARGLGGLDAPALPGNRAAKAFFEGHGFLARLLVMHRPVHADAQGGAVEA